MMATALRNASFPPMRYPASIHILKRYRTCCHIVSFSSIDLFMSMPARYLNLWSHCPQEAIGCISQPRNPPTQRPFSLRSNSTHLRKKSEVALPHQLEQVAQLCQSLGILLFIYCRFGLRSFILGKADFLSRKNRFRFCFCYFADMMCFENIFRSATYL